MNDIEMRYFEEYKIVEKICNDMYSSNSGISDYIEQMENTPSYEAMSIDNWEKNYRYIKHARWLRNQIAHYGEDYEVTQEDIEDIIAFHKDIINGTDPLAQLRKRRVQSSMKVVEKPVQHTSSQPQYNYNPVPKPDDAPSFWIALVGFLFPLIGLLLYIVLQGDQPQKAKSAGKGALVSVILKAVLGLIIYACGGLAFFEGLKYALEEDTTEETVTDYSDYDDSLEDYIEDYQ